METQTIQKNNEDTGNTARSFAYNKQIQGMTILALFILSIFLFAQSINMFKEYHFIGKGTYPSNTITVTGEGELFAVPDTAEFTFTISEEAQTAAEVQKIATEKTNAVINALKEKGVEEKDVKTIEYALYPRYEWVADIVCTQFSCPRNQKQTGFTLSQSMSIKVRDLDKAGELLELVTNKEVSNVRGLTFTVADEDAVQNDARKMAIDDAEVKAEKLAKDLGVSLVTLVGFSEGEEYRPVMYDSMVAESLEMGGAKSASVMVPEGENRIVSNVTLTYEIR